MKRIRLMSVLVLLCAMAPALVFAQTHEAVRQAMVASYLDDLRADLKRSYYDRTFRGIDIEAAYDSARAELLRAKTDQGRYRAIDRFLEPLDDSHTYFMAPRRIGLSDFHFGVRFFDQSAFIVSVVRGSQADSAGLRAGDEIVHFAGQTLTRQTYRRVVSDFLASHPIKSLDLDIRAPDGSAREITVTADTMASYRTKGSEFRKLISRFRDSGKLATSHVQAAVTDTVFVWRLPQFPYSNKGIDDVMERVRKHRVLVLDLRGNGGGAIATLTKLAGHFVDYELVVGDLRTRSGSRKFIAKPRKERFTGRFFILVNSETGSAAEIFARLMQLEGKATVVGDRTAGAVMASQFFEYDDGAGASITVSDFVLYNGERLEKVGVEPDVFAVPTAQHIAAGTDPLLSYALSQAGARVSPSAARQVMPAR